MDTCGAGKEEVMLEADSKMEAENEEPMELLVSVVYTIKEVSVVGVVGVIGVGVYHK